MENGVETDMLGCIVEKGMETTAVREFMMEKKMETTRAFRVLGA